MRKLVIALVLLSRIAAAQAGTAPVHGPYGRAGCRMADDFAATMSVMPAYATMGACGMTMLPADPYWTIARPEDAFGSERDRGRCANLDTSKGSQNVAGRARRPRQGLAGAALTQCTELSELAHRPHIP